MWNAVFVHVTEKAGQHLVDYHLFFHLVGQSNSYVSNVNTASCPVRHEPKRLPCGSLCIKQFARSRSIDYRHAVHRDGIVAFANLGNHALQGFSRSTFNELSGTGGNHVVHLLGPKH